MILINSYGGPDSTAYIDLVTANTLITTSLVYFDEWTLANTVQRNAAIMQAAKQIGSQRWKGSKYFARQRLAFPRVPEEFDSPLGGTAGPDASSTQYFLLEDYHRLQKERVEAANAYQAYFILKCGGEQPYREDQLQGMNGRSKSLRFSDSWNFQEPTFVLCPEAWDELKHYRASGPRIVRGAGEPGTKYAE